jgi:hypothetical protein
VRFQIAAIGLICSLIATPATAAPLQPFTKWSVDYGVTQCTSARSYGSAVNPIVLGIIPSINGLAYKLVVGIQREGPTYGKEYKGTVDFGPGKIKSWLLYYGRKDSRTSNYEFHLSHTQIDQARAAGSVAVAVGSRSGESYEFALSDMPALLNELTKCTANLQQYWNFGEAMMALPGSPLMGQIRGLFTSQDYPDAALSRNQEGAAQYQLLVDERGVVAGCDLLYQSGVPVLDAMGCLVIKGRAKLTPQNDKTGKAVRSVVTTPRIVWGLWG